MPCSACGKNGQNASVTKPRTMVLGTRRRVVRSVQRPSISQLNVQLSNGKKNFILGRR